MPSRLLADPPRVTRLARAHQLHASPALCLTGDAGDLQIWTLRPADVDPSTLDLSVLDATERSRAETFKRPADSVSYIAAHIHLRELLGMRLGLPPNGVSFGRQRCPRCGGRNGRPVVAGSPDSPHFSISRSEGLVMIGIASVPVGIDLEPIRSADHASEVSALLHAGERAEILSAEGSRRTEVFTRLWTRKEAYLKGTGSGIAHGLDADYLGTQQLAPPPRGWIVLDLPIAAGYWAAAAIQSRPAEPRTY